MINRRGTKIIRVHPATQVAFPLGNNRVLCPVCSEEQSLPPKSRLESEDNYYLFLCCACRQQFMHNEEKVKLPPIVSAPDEKDHLGFSSGFQKGKK